MSGSDSQRKSLPTIVLVPGMWHAASAWEAVVKLLEADGFPCVPVTLPGPGRAGGDATFHGHRDHLERVLAGVAGGVVLVGHSYGGAVIGEIRAVPAVRSMIFVAAFCLEVGESVAAVNDAQPGSDAGASAIVRSGDYLSMAPETAKDAFYHDCPPAVTEQAVASLTPEFHDTRTTRATRAAWREVPSHYVVCTQDRAIVPDVQRALAARLDSVREIDSGHCPMLSQPDRLAGIIADVAVRTTRQ
ncbi:alpha/beta hydrolase [Amycolatopsis sp. NPDC050768]|uniref:alpha/beta hydrolase n=1 Tax=Amycolatopsis sp. NPDC050768 TaxID=3154839 RepID=UPI0034051BC9